MLVQEVEPALLSKRTQLTQLIMVLSKRTPAQFRLLGITISASWDHNFGRIQHKCDNPISKKKKYLLS